MIKIKSSIELTLAWRNVWKNKRRTILTLLTIMVGCAMIILMKAMQEGGYAQMIDDAVAANPGHIQIHEKGFWSNMSIDYAFKPDETIQNILRTSPFIAAYSIRVQAGGLVFNGENTEGTIIQGIDPDTERTVSVLHKHVLPGGRFLKKDDTDKIIIGATLAKNLQVSVGDTVSMISQGFDGSIAADNLVIVGLFRSGNPEYDMGLAIMPLSRAMDKFSMMGYVNSITILLKDGRMMEQARDVLKRRIHRKNLEIMGWDELIPELVQYIYIDRTSAYIFYFILFMIVAFGILNTIQMSVYERIREFGVMMAIGTRPDQITRIIIIESVFITILGIILGTALGSALSYYFTVHPIDYSAYQKEIELFGIATTILPAKLELSNIVSTSIITFIVSITFTIFPARRAARLRPIDAIRKL